MTVNKSSECFWWVDIPPLHACCLASSSVGIAETRMLEKRARSAGVSGEKCILKSADWMIGIKLLSLNKASDVLRFLLYIPSRYQMLYEAIEI